MPAMQEAKLTRTPHSDTLLLGQFYAQPAFAKRFGILDVATGTYQIPAKWQTGLSCSASVGQILGLQITGWASDRFGYRKTMFLALGAITGLLFLQFFAQNLPMLLAAYLLLGFPWGTFQTMVGATASCARSSTLTSAFVTDRRIRRRAHACADPALLDHLRQPVLGLWPDHCEWFGLAKLKHGS